MKLLLGIAFALLALPSLAVPLEIKGFQVDTPVDCAKINEVGAEVGPSPKPLSCESGKPFWSISGPFLDGYSVITFVQSQDRVLLSVGVSRIKFTDTLNALTVKYGPPTVKNSVIQNRMGASFDQVEASWKDGATALTLMKHGSTIDSPVLRLTGSELAKDSAKRSQEKAIKGAGNL